MIVENADAPGVAERDAGQGNEKGEPAVSALDCDYGEVGEEGDAGDGDEDGAGDEAGTVAIVGEAGRVPAGV